jgi:hypothetical protein
LSAASGYRQRRGASTMGCLVSLLVTSAIIYFGINAFEVYWRFVEYRDEMRAQVRFSQNTSNEYMLKRLHAVADSLELPEGAHDIYIERANGTITIEAEYEDRIELPFMVRIIRFAPKAEGRY